jgi:hypothetical protein
MNTTIVYGLGGYDPSKPNDNIVEIIKILGEKQESEDDPVGLTETPAIEMVNGAEGPQE